MSSNIFCLFLFFYISQNLVTCLSNDTDMQSLVAIKKAISTDPQGFLNSWNETTHFCSWDGILCSKIHPGRVLKIDLLSRGLIGSLSPHLGNLSFLRSIVLKNNSFFGPIPQEIGRLKRLEYVEFSNNTFSGEIPRNLSQCTKIFFLNLIDNNHTGVIIPELGFLLQLRSLGLAINPFSGTIPTFFGNLTNLRILSVSYCAIGGEIPDTLSQLQSLFFLDLNFNHLTGRIPHGLYNISTLTFFSIFSNQLHGTIPSEILPKLIILDFSSNFFTGAIPPSLSNSTLIKEIYFDSNSFTGRIMIDFSRLSALQVFDVAVNKIEGNLSFIASMSNCSVLQVLELNGNLFSGPFPNSVTNLSSQLNFLSMGENLLHGSIPSGIGNLVGLSSLRMSNNDFEGTIPPEIGKLNKLQEIHFGGNSLTNEIPFSIGNLSLLNKLFMEFNDFSGSIPQSLGNCIELSLLSLSHNNISGSVPREILILSSLSIFLDLSYNTLTGTIPSEVGSLTNLAKLDLSNNRLSGQIPDSLSKCILLDQIHLESNSFSGQIPYSLISLRGMKYLDLSQNNLSGPIPIFLEEMDLVYLNLSFNSLQGQVPTLGVFQNGSGVSIEGNINLCGGVEILKLHSCSMRTYKKKHMPTLLQILIPCGAVAILIAITTCLFYFMSRKCSSTNIESCPPSNLNGFLRLSFEDLFKATSGFSASNLLGAGKFGSVYKGILADKDVVAVKVLNLNTEGASKSFMSECNALKNIRHRNLLKILSVCSSIDSQGNDFKALVYDLKANGTVDEWLHEKLDEERRNFSMRCRLNIAMNIASALEYLHRGTGSIIVHGDLKPSNVLLDENFTAHVGDFGLAKVFSSTFSTSNESNSFGIKGTIGYIPPEYGISHMLSVEGDVYSYGILLLEMFTGRRPTDYSFENHSTLRNFVESTLPDEVMKVLDPTILQEFKAGADTGLNDGIISVLGIALACSVEVPSDRMPMSEVVNRLCEVVDMIVSVQL